MKTFKVIVHMMVGYTITHWVLVLIEAYRMAFGMDPWLVYNYENGLAGMLVIGFVITLVTGFSWGVYRDSSMYR